jgi:small-conductance mechanosensitive channel
MVGYYAPVKEIMTRVACFLTACFLLLVINAFSVSAQTSSAPAKPQESIPGKSQESIPAKPQEDTSSGYPVTLGGQTIFSIKGEVPGYSAKERAKGVSNRVRALAEDFTIPIESITTSDYNGPSTLVVADDKLVLGVYAEDAKAENRSRQQLATEYTQKLRSAIEHYRAEHSRKRILTSTLYLLAVTLVLIALLYLLNRLYRIGDARIKAWADSKKISIHIQSFELVRAERIKTTLVGASKIIRFAVWFILFYTYAHLGLSFFPWTHPFSGQLLGYVLASLSAVAWGIWMEIPDLLILAVIAAIAYYALKMARLFFSEVEKGTISFKGFYPEWAQPTYKIVRILIVAFAAVIAFPYIPGSQSPAFKGISIFLGVLFSLGSTSAVANILAGYTLTYRRIFKVGDRVKIADFTGDVIDIRLQVVHLRTIKNEEIVVPSSTIVNSHVINYSSLARTQGLILHTSVTIGYDTPWRQVEALLLMAAEKTPEILREPAPFILQTSLDDFYVAYELNVYTDDPLKMAETYTDLHRNIQDSFNEYGVQIMSPSYRFDPERPKIVAKEQWYAAPAKPPDVGEKKS